MSSKDMALCLLLILSVLLSYMLGLLSRKQHDCESSCLLQNEVVLLFWKHAIAALSDHKAFMEDVSVSAPSQTLRCSKGESCSSSTNYMQTDKLHQVGCILGETIKTAQRTMLPAGDMDSRWNETLRRWRRDTAACWNLLLSSDPRSTLVRILSPLMLKLEHAEAKLRGCERLTSELQVEALEHLERIEEYTQEIKNHSRRLHEMSRLFSVSNHHLLEEVTSGAELQDKLLETIGERRNFFYKEEKNPPSEAWPVHHLLETFLQEVSDVVYNAV